MGAENKNGATEIDDLQFLAADQVSFRERSNLPRWLSALAATELLLTAAGVGVATEVSTSSAEAAGCVDPACTTYVDNALSKWLIPVDRAPDLPPPKPSPTPTIIVKSPVTKPPSVKKPHVEVAATHAATTPLTLHFRPRLASSEPENIDISWPQGKYHTPLPPTAGFVIVGINGGKESNADPYLSDFMRYAARFPKPQFYVNTANPGPTKNPLWPKNNVDPAGKSINNPYGACHGEDSPACAYTYGVNRVMDAVYEYFQPATNGTGIKPDPRKYQWWLDVETGNKWQRYSAEGQRRDAAVLEGETARFKKLHIPLGIYATDYQLGQIVGDDTPHDATTNAMVPKNMLYLPAWVPADGKAGAQKACRELSPIPGGKVAMTQYVFRNLDHEIVCAQIK